MFTSSTTVPQDLTHERLSGESEMGAELKMNRYPQCVIDDLGGSILKALQGRDAGYQRGRLTGVGQVSTGAGGANVAFTGRSLRRDLAPYLTELRHACAVAWWALWSILSPAVPRSRPVRPAAPLAPEPAPVETAPAPPAPEAAPVLLAPGDRAALLRLLVRHEWSVSQIRATLKGDNNALSAEIEQARAALGVTAPRRVVTVGNGKYGDVEL
jgi:hypothetical protein